MAKANDAETQEPVTVEEKVEIAPPPGHVTLRGGNCSVDGVQYHAENGVVFVRAEHAAELVAHGLERV